MRIPEEHTAALRRLANDLAVPQSSVLLTAHAKVLGALSGQSDVCTGYEMPDGRVVPCNMTLGDRTWREAILNVARVQDALLEHEDHPGLAEPSFETVFAWRAAGETPDTGAVLQVAFVDRGELVLRLRHKEDVVDSEYAARIAGYHLAAVALIASDPDALHLRQSLLSPEELHFQIHGLAGPHRELPNRRAHELFEEQARTQPDAIAATHGESALTYGELNARANHLARAMLARGLTREGVVGVATERNLDWLAAVLAIFKAGGAYLPIEPHFPTARVADMLARAECKFVLTGRGSTSMVEEAFGSPARGNALLIDALFAEGHSDDDPNIRVAPGQLAYIYFTSGSTGLPKGAMCEHAGMQNHLFAKIDDLGIAKGDVVAQTAPQCFDISLWQLLAALLAGGRTLIVEQEAILDANRFVDTIVTGNVAVVQVVPSYLQIIVSYLERHPRELPDLRCVSVTGEALKKELVERWFAVQPGIKLVNAYGLTETSDDTNHEIMDGVPRHERVPLGRPVNNVHVYVVDENLSPVPLGAPGEIVVSGVCVGRGYINDPDRTERAFLADPHREGHRLYRTGDQGRWLPEGKLEFLGRRDAQVKISGFRIEIGEIESALLRLSDVREGVVVVTDGARDQHLVAFYVGEGPVDSARMQARLAEWLPSYMVPSAFHRRPTLPVTGNGKVDRRALSALATDMAGEMAYDAALKTPTERRLAAAWATVLGISGNQIGRQHDFFELGGTSLSALRLVIALDRALSFKDLADHAVLADQAALIDRRSVSEISAIRPAAGGGTTP